MVGHVGSSRARDARLRSAEEHEKAARDAWLRAAELFENAARRYERSAEFWDHYGYQGRAEAARRAAATNLQKAKRAREPARV